MFEIGVWASWEVTKYVTGGLWSALKYRIWGREMSPEELFQANLLQRIADLEHSNEELTAAVLAHGDEPESSGAPLTVPGKPKVKQTITYVDSSDVQESDDTDRKPPPPPASSAIQLPTVPTHAIEMSLKEPKFQRGATML